MREGGDSLAPAERDFLRALAWAVVEAAAAGTAAPDLGAFAAARGVALAGVLADPRGAFVTLHRAGELRGCIGSIVSDRSLARTVADAAWSAACRDPRFAPVAPDEVALLDLEISALSPLREVAGPEAIELGRHGILLDRGGRQAVFLPQVAPEQGWDLETTLDHLARKAGLRPGAWRSGARFRVFEAEVF